MAQLPRWSRPVAILAALFGVATIYSGGTALFGGPAAREAVGDAVPLVLWFNFLAGFAYVLAAVALFVHASWARYLAWLIAASTLLVFAIFAVMALSGTPFEWRTVAAMALRSGFWLATALALSGVAGRNPQR